MIGRVHVASLTVEQPDEHRLSRSWKRSRRLEGCRDAPLYAGDSLVVPASGSKRATRTSEIASQLEVMASDGIIR